MFRKLSKHHKDGELYCNEIHSLDAGFYQSCLFLYSVDDDLLFDEFWEDRYSDAS